MSQKTNCAQPHRPQSSDLMTAFDITREEDGSKGRYVIKLDGAEAELTYSIAHR